MRLFLVSLHLLMFLVLLDQSRAQTAMPIETTTPETTTDTTPETTTDTTTPETTTDTTIPETTDTTTLEPTTDTTIPETTDTTTPETTTDTTIPETTDTTTPETTTDTTIPETTDTTTPETTTDTTIPETTDTTTPETTTDTTIPETTDTTTPETTTDTTIPEPFTFSTVVASTTAWTAPAIFYPFGSAAGDSEHLESGFETYQYVAFSTPFTYFGRKYSNIFVNYNGLLTFNQPLVETFPYSFPTYENEDYIAALWSELDDYGFGKYWYQEYTNGSVLDRATQDINQYFPNRGFTASWVFVVTWDYMLTTDWNTFNLHSEPAITFQAVLISGGGLSFILMNYGDCAAITFPVESGYDTINSTDYYVILNDYYGSYTPNLQNTTNVNVPGRWAFLVNNGTENLIGLQINLRSFLDLTQTENVQSVLQLIKQELVRQGVSSQFGLKLRKLQKIWP
ncbi:uncharacterized protein isoform X1 [Danio rerio]|uniref:Uncharacterized protein isoform X1 n=1 Tax=Danio rerio TaxID=7955 RepID=A0A8M3AYM9_DANRE|nr:uncharacterized protein LOC100536599 [Danio rerio]|eukprot:XP_009305186.1 uncharacterized protein LOC100536599 [Danio rerio]